jgi:hypothetical protein
MLKNVLLAIAAILVGAVAFLAVSSLLGCGGSGSVDSYSEDAGTDTDTDIDTDKNVKGLWECLICR